MPLTESYKKSPTQIGLKKRFHSSNKSSPAPPQARSSCGHPIGTGVTGVLRPGYTPPDVTVSAFPISFCCFSLCKSCLTLLAHGRQHTRLPCPSASPRVFSGSCPLSLSNHIEPSYPLPHSLPFSFSLSQHQGLF